MYVFLRCGVQVRDLDSNSQRLMQTHPDQAESIYEHQAEINEMWNTLTIKVLPYPLRVSLKPGITTPPTCHFEAA